MTQRHKDFGGVEDLIEDEPVTFSLMGQNFTAKPQMNGAVLLQFVREADSGHGGRASEALLGLFEKVLTVESYERFEKMANDPDIPIRVEKLGEICGWLVEVYTARPTKVRSTSSASAEEVGRTSTVAASATG